MRFSRATRPSTMWRAATVPAFVLFAIGCGGDSAAPKGTLVLSDASVTFDAEDGGSNPQAQLVEVTNSTTAEITDLAAAITYGASQPTGWLNASLSGDVAPATLTLTPALGALDPGNYTANVAVSGDNASNSPQTVNVTLRVAALLGFPTVFPNGSGHSPDYLLGHTINVPAAAQLASVNFIVKDAPPAGAQIKVGIYGDAGGSPGALVASTPATNVVVGRNEIPVTASLSAGNYWFMVTFSHTVNLGQQSGTASTTIKYISHPFANPLPAAFPASPTTYTGYNFNVFLKTYTP